jgi:acetylornithine deacetylase
LLTKALPGRKDVIMTGVTRELKEHIVEKVDNSSDEIFRTIQQLIRIPSVMGKEGEAQYWIEGLYQSLGLDVTRVLARKDELVEHPAYIETGLPYDESRPNIVGRLPGKREGRSLILNGHVDVVPAEPEEMWDRGGPWSGAIEGNRLYGRGSADMKSGLMSNYFAVKMLLDLGLQPQGDVMLQSVIEEEAGGSGGTLATLMAGYRADAMVIPEPFDLKIITAHPGVNYFRVKVTGRTAHAAQSHEGVNAIGLLTKIYERLMQLDEERARRHRNDFFEKVTGRSCNLNIGTFKAGDWASTVAGAAELEGRVSYLPGETEDGIKAEVSRVIADVAREDPWLKRHSPEIEWFGWRAQPWEQDDSVPFVRQFREIASDVLGAPAETAAATCGLDTRFGPMFEVPAIVFGPRGGVLHSFNEYVELDSVISVVKVLACFIVDWCGADY